MSLFTNHGIFHENRGFLNNYLHVLCNRMITRHSQIKSKPILERRMIALINERLILMITYTFYAEKWQSIEKNWSKIHFFLKSLSSPSSRDLDQDIWQIIFKLNLFRRTLVRFTLSLAEAAPEGGRKFWITLYVCHSRPALTTPTIFLMFGMKVGDH